MVMEANAPPDVTPTDTDDLELPAEQVVVAYHERTKHHYHRYAASLGYLDWAKQPDPFRRYNGAQLVRLPLPEEGRALPFWQLYVADNVVKRCGYRRLWISTLSQTWPKCWRLKEHSSRRWGCNRGRSNSKCGLICG
jgi:hypothetical protein